MKDLIIGVIIGGLLVSLAFITVLQQGQISMLEVKQQVIIKDIESLWFKFNKK